jgi:hypothetical protein
MGGVLTLLIVATMLLVTLIQRPPVPTHADTRKPRRRATTRTKINERRLTGMGVRDG